VEAKQLDEGIGDTFVSVGATMAVSINAWDSPRIPAQSTAILFFEQPSNDRGEIL
jgi:hypothetical protein